MIKMKSYLNEQSNSEQSENAIQKMSARVPAVLVSQFSVLHVHIQSLGPVETMKTT